MPTDMKVFDFVDSLEQNCLELRKALREESPVPAHLILDTLQRRIDTIREMVKDAH